MLATLDRGETSCRAARCFGVRSCRRPRLPGRRRRPAPGQPQEKGKTTSPEGRAPRNRRGVSGPGRRGRGQDRGRARPAGLLLLRRSPAGSGRAAAGRQVRREHRARPRGDRGGQARPQDADHPDVPRRPLAHRPGPDAGRAGPGMDRARRGHRGHDARAGEAPIGPPRLPAGRPAGFRPGARTDRRRWSRPSARASSPRAGRSAAEKRPSRSRRSRTPPPWSCARRSRPSARWPICWRGSPGGPAREGAAAGATHAGGEAAQGAGQPDRFGVSTTLRSNRPSRRSPGSTALRSSWTPLPWIESRSSPMCRSRSRFPGCRSARRCG